MGCNNSTAVPYLDERAVIHSSTTQHSTHTRILQDEVVDYCVTQSPPPEKSFFLDLGDFIDGMLGVCDTDLIIEKLSKLSEGELFEDEEFPADKTSLSFSNPSDPEFEDIIWKRPHEISEAPYLFVDGTSRSDVKQGNLGDCWFLSACASVAKRQDLIEKVIDPSQRLFGDGYCGALIINFWRFGDWVSVHIDDRLPTKNGQLIYGSCTDSNEFWLAMVEKAFAKLHGSYEGLGGGHALEAFVDLTGGIAERIKISKDIFKQLATIFMHGAFITCSRKSDLESHRSRSAIDRAKGLVEGHAYTVTSLATVQLLNGGSVNLVRIRNPWGDSVEWKGAWSDRSAKWEDVSESDKKKLRVTALDDGEFWMNYEDFQDMFDNVTVATIGPDFNQDGVSDTPRQVNIIKNSWKKGFNGGGCRNDLEKFSLNPQYLLSLTEPDDLNADPDAPVEKGKCSVLVGLMQEHRRSEKNKPLALLPIAFFIYKTETPDERLSAEYFLCMPEEISSGDFTNSREVLIRTHFDPGDYVIIPATFYPDCETNFLIRVFALRPFKLTEIQEPNYNNLDDSEIISVSAMTQTDDQPQENPCL